MNSPPDAAYAEVRDTDPDTLDSGELDAYLRRVAELRASCDARQVRATRRQRALAAEGRATDPRHSLANHGRQSSKEAAAATERERVCTTMPGFQDALTDGVVSAGHVDAVANATKNLSEGEQAEFAGRADDLVADAGRHASMPSPATVVTWRAGSAHTTTPAATSTNSSNSDSSRRSPAGSTGRPGCTRH